MNKNSNLYFLVNFGYPLLVGLLFMLYYVFQTFDNFMGFFLPSFILTSVYIFTAKKTYCQNSFKYFLLSIGIILILNIVGVFSTNCDEGGLCGLLYLIKIFFPIFFYYIPMFVIYLIYRFIGKRT